MSRITISNSSNIYINIPFLDSVFIQDILIENNSAGVYEIPVFFMSSIHNLVINNFTVRNSVGEILLLYGVLNKVMTNCYFENVSNPNHLPDRYQNQIRIEHTKVEMDLNQTKYYTTILQNVSVNVRR